MSLRWAFVRFNGFLRSMEMDTYRPERHYMRGAGPACRRKQVRGGI